MILFKKIGTFLSITFLLLFQASYTVPNGTELIKADVIIYGGTSAAIMSAVQISKMNKTVVIVSPDKHLGGLSSSGLGFTDTGDKSVIGGLSREFYQRIYQYYQKSESWKGQKKEAYGNVGQGTPAIDGENRTMWIFEPHIAEQVFEDLVKEYRIQVFRDEWLDRKHGVLKKGTIIKEITTLSGKRFKGSIYIDATYEGDLLAASGVSYHVGRESNNQYNEKWNGIQKGVFHHGHHFNDIKRISPYIISDDSTSGLLPKVSNQPVGENGEADSKIQAYCFRMCLTKNQDNLVPIKKPQDYNSAQYELLVRVFDAGWDEFFSKFDPIPNLKTDVNNHGPFSFDNIGMNYDYPEATYERREVIVKEHETYQKGLIYFIQTDPRVPAKIQEEMKRWGLAKDEFVDNGNWPYLLYIREARRMIGLFVMTENEILGRIKVKESIGMGSYTMDSHNTQRYVTSEGYVQNEGDVGVHPKQAYRIALGSILPKKKECENLIVPVAVSSSHIAYGSIRMEPVFMILGQSAGIIAALALSEGVKIHQLEYSKIRKVLLQYNQKI